jgi:hypothetical protein
MKAISACLLILLLLDPLKAVKQDDDIWSSLGGYPGDDTGGGGGGGDDPYGGGDDPYGGGDGGDDPYGGGDGGDDPYGGGGGDGGGDEPYGGGDDVPSEGGPAPTPPKTDQAAQKLYQSAPSGQKTSYLTSMSSSYKLWPYAWIIYHTRWEKFLKWYKPWASHCILHYYALKCISGFKGDAINGPWKGKIIWTYKVYPKFCFIAQHHISKHCYLIACWNAKKHILHAVLVCKIKLASAYTLRANDGGDGEDWGGVTDMMNNYSE